MILCFLRILFSSFVMLYSTAQPIFDCPKTVAVGDTAKLTCSNLTNIVNIENPAEMPVGTCVKGTCDTEIEGVNITFFEDNTVLLTVQDINKEDEGVWTCRSTTTATCSLNVYQLPSCKISSTNSTNNLSLGQDLPLNINLTDYYCTNSIVWNLTIGEESKNVTEFGDREETNDSTSRVITYSTTVTSSLTGRVELTFNCNDESYNVSCSGVKELQLRDPPSFNLTSDEDTDDLTVGNDLTLEANIEEYPCTTNIKYVLLSGSGMVADFVKNANSFYATFEVKPEYLDKQLHLKYTCNSVSATTRTEGVTILRTKNGVQSPGRLTETEWIIIYVAIALVVIVIVIITVIVICRCRRKKKSMNNDPPYSDAIDTLPGRTNSLKVTSNNMYTKVSDVNGSLKKHHFEADDVNGNPKGGLSEIGDVKGSQKKLRDEAGRDGNLNDKSRQRSICQMVPNTAYESVDVIRLELKEKQKGTNLKCPEGMYAKVDKQRSQKNGVPDLVASAKM